MNVTMLSLNSQVSGTFTSFNVYVIFASKSSTIIFPEELVVKIRLYSLLLPSVSLSVYVKLYVTFGIVKLELTFNFVKSKSYLSTIFIPTLAGSVESGSLPPSVMKS